jgi:hypothetical protein
MTSRFDRPRPRPNVPKHAAACANVPAHEPRGAAVQPAGATPRKPHVFRPQQQTPKAPAPYRPQPAPKVLQRKPAAPAQLKPHAPAPPRPRAQPEPVSPHRPTPAAPPAYRPQPTPHALQRKTACGHAHAAHAPFARTTRGALTAQVPPTAQRTAGMSVLQTKCPAARTPAAPPAGRPSRGVLQMMEEERYTRQNPRRSTRERKEVQNQNVLDDKEFSRRLRDKEAREREEAEEKLKRIEKKRKREQEKLLEALREEELRPRKKQRTNRQRPWDDDERPDVRPEEVAGLLGRAGVMDLILSGSHESLKRLWVEEGLANAEGEPTARGRQFLFDVIDNKAGYMNTARFTFLMHCGEPSYLKQFESTRGLGEFSPPPQVTLEEWGDRKINLQRVHETAKGYRGLQLHPSRSYVEEREFYTKLVDKGDYSNSELALTNLIGPKDEYEVKSKIEDESHNVRHRSSAWLRKFEMGRYTKGALPQKVAMVNVRNTLTSITDYQMDAPMSDGGATTATNTRNIDLDEYRGTVEEIHRKCMVEMGRFISSYLTTPFLLSRAEQDYAEAVVYILWKKKGGGRVKQEVKEYFFDVGGYFARSPRKESDDETD